MSHRGELGSNELVAHLRSLAAAVARSLFAAVGPEAVLMASVSWKHSSYDRTLDGARLTDEERDRWPASDPSDAPSGGSVAEVLCPEIGASAGKLFASRIQKWIIDVYAQQDAPAAVDTIAKPYMELGRHRKGMVGGAKCHLFDAPALHEFGLDYLENRSGRGIVRGEL